MGGCELNLVNQHTLQNGMPVLTLEKKGRGLISFWLWYRVGSRNEVPGSTGLSHWVEHMMFKGTPTYPESTLDKLLNESGGRWNAFTTADATAYYTTLPAARLQTLLRIECDRMVNTQFIATEVDTERQIILAELAGYENEPRFWLEEAVESTAYTTHPYRQSILGTREDLHSITTARLYAHYRRYYQPAGAIAVVVGDFNTAELLEQLERSFGQLPAGKAEHQDVPIEPQQQEPRVITVRRPGPTTYLDIAYHIPAAHHPDRVALTLIDSLLTGGKPPSSWNGGKVMGRSSLLYQQLVDGGLATEVYSEAHPTIDPGLFRINVTLRPDADVDHVESLVLRTVEQLATTLVAEADLARARKQCRAQFAYSQESVESTALLLGVYAVTGGLDYLARYLDRLDSCSAEEIRRVAATYLRPDNRTIGRFIPVEETDETGRDFDEASETTANEATGGADVDFSSSAPEENAVQAAQTLQKARQAAGLTLYTPQSLRTALPGPDRIRRVRLQPGVTVLACGSDSDTVTFKVAAPAGSAYDGPLQAGLAYLVSSALIRGTQLRSNKELHTLTDAMGMSVSISCDEEFASLEISCLAEDVRLAAELLAEVWLQPSLSDDSIHKEIGKLLAAIGEREDDTRAVADRVWKELAYADHCFAHPVDGYANTVERLEPQQCRQFHACHYLAGPSTLCVTGGIDPQHAIDLLAQVWRQPGNTGATHNTLLNELPPSAKGASRRLHLAGKSQADITLGLPTLPYNAAEYPAFYIGNLILGRLGIYGRLGARVRERLGLAYYVYSSIEPKRIASPWTVRAGVDPACVEQAIEAILQEIRRITATPVFGTELAEAVGYVLGSLPMKLECSVDLADTLLDMELYNLGLDYLQTFQERVIHTTGEDVQTAMAKYLLPECFSYAVVGP
jgi:zinc protease